ncbi:TIGR03767 family metallophosphoesterase [Ochrobactrum chromiisoli]|uniref:TIGR03767 family metallophosphoesterase n=1 Tax=Ochrobactrum chromiisoli TaxID=2993941 RepID=A0ABT3QT54_9HYPH|nr:TIGR03767 family metallophosphoesterase [Ochrobactrum chromiisoli]MCX2698818.1 TIGR03767 family metallophosphoesterase [Ochrobactrum chromiisoli]
MSIKSYSFTNFALSRRNFIKASCAAPFAVCGCASHNAMAQSRFYAEAVTTLEESVVPGDYLKKGKPYRKTAVDNGWPIIVRQDLSEAFDGREKSRKALVSFVQITDLHIIDASSPGHTAFMRQYAGPNGNIDGAPLVNAWRPQETLTVHVLDAMIRRLNALSKGPVSGRKFDFAISTGDSADTRAMHELETVLSLLNGEWAVMSASGTEYVGVQSNHGLSEETYDVYWHPEPTSNGYKADLWKRAFGYPEVEGFLAAISQPVKAEGFKMPWYSGFGNHDQLDYGVFGAGNITDLISAQSVSNRVITALPKTMPPEMFIGAVTQGTNAQIQELMSTLPTMETVASINRRPFSKEEFIQKHLDAAGAYGPVGHGFSTDNLAQQTAYYTFNMADGVIGIMLDSTNPNGGPDGSLDTPQAEWLERQLTENSSKYYATDGSIVNSANKDAIVVIFSHHNSITFDNLKRAPAGQPDNTRIGGAEFIALLSRFPNVVLWVNGHTHCNRIWSHYDPRNNQHGFWEVNTAAHIDYPQQSRTIEIFDNRDGTLSIFGTIIDHSSPDSIIREGPQTAASLAALSLELAMNDPALDRAYRLGVPEDLNVELIVKKPF